MTQRLDPPLVVHRDSAPGYHEYGPVAWVMHPAQPCRLHPPPPQPSPLDEQTTMMETDVPAFAEQFATGAIRLVPYSANAQVQTQQPPQTQTSVTATVATKAENGVETKMQVDM